MTEFCEGGQLFDFIIDHGVMDEKLACKIIKPIVSGIMYCHFHNIIHRDLKPENILLMGKTTPSAEDFQIRIIDFGSSRVQIYFIEIEEG